MLTIHTSAKTSANNLMSTDPIVSPDEGAERLQIGSVILTEQQVQYVSDDGDAAYGENAQYSPTLLSSLWM